MWCHFISTSPCKPWSVLLSAPFLAYKAFGNMKVVNLVPRERNSSSCGSKRNLSERVNMLAVICMWRTVDLNILNHGKSPVEQSMWSLHVIDILRLGHEPEMNGLLFNVFLWHFIVLRPRDRFTENEWTV